MLRRLSVTFVAFGLLATVLVSKTAAITGNFVPDFTHPYVGLIALYDDNGEYVGRCSGTLLSPTIVLTAAHCLSPARAVASARIWFHQDAGSQFDPFTELDVHTGYPDYCVPGDPLCVESHTLIPMAVFPDENTQLRPVALSPDRQDVGIVLLDTAVSTSAISEYGVLAAPHTLDDLASTPPRAARPTVTLSGYGLTATHPEFDYGGRQRLMVTATILNVHNSLTAGFNVQISMNPGNNRGGQCFGDSGGPLFWGNTNIVLGVASFVNSDACAGVGFDYRVDTEAVYAWITEVTGVTLPTAQP